MPIGTCDPATRGEAFNEDTVEQPNPNGSGSVLANIRWDWDGVSQKPTCNGPVISIRTRNTSNSPGWVNLPKKKKGNPWVQVDPGTDVTISAQGQLNNL